MKQTFPLRFPVEHGGENVGELALRRPTIGDIEKTAGGTGNQVTLSLKMVADLSERPIELIRKLDPEDYADVEEWLKPILDPKARQAGSR